MKTADFDYDLPQELIAQDPLEQRDSSRLLILDKETGERTHKIFHDIIDYLHEGDCLVINNTKVIPARLIGEREGTGGKGRGSAFEAQIGQCLGDTGKARQEGKTGDALILRRRTFARRGAGGCGRGQPPDPV